MSESVPSAPENHRFTKGSEVVLRDDAPKTVLTNYSHGRIYTVISVHKGFRKKSYDTLDIRDDKGYVTSISERWFDPAPDDSDEVII